MKIIPMALLILSAIQMSASPSSANLPDGVDGVIGLYPIQQNTCLAVEISLPGGMPLLGLTWFNNDSQASFEKVILVEATKDMPPDLLGSGLVLAEQSGPSLQWGQMTLGSGVTSTTGRVFAVFVFPAGGERTGLGSGEGAGIGYKESERAPRAFLSGDGLQWVQLDSDYEVLVTPSYALSKGAGSEPGSTVVLSSLGELGLALSESDGDSSPGGTPYVAQEPGIVSVIPNPFNPQTEITFRTVAAGPVQLSLYDVRGRRVAVLADEEMLAGTHSFLWAGADEHGHSVASGVYYLKMRTPEHHSVRTITLLK